MSSDLRLFLSQLFTQPLKIVALAPSSEALAREMAATLDPAAGPVIELGAGTGKITRAILARGVPPQDIHAIKMNPVFCDRLRMMFPGINVHQCCAAEIATLPVQNAQAVISGLPLLSMPHNLQEAILRGTYACMRPGGKFVQFTYGPTPPVNEALRLTLNLSWKISRKVWNNLPPARVYRFAKEAAL